MLKRLFVYVLFLIPMAVFGFKRFFNENGQYYLPLYLPESFVRNQSGYPWTTAGIVGGNQSSETNTGRPEGTFPDFIGIKYWYISVPYQGNQTSPVFNFLHTYYAGTSNAEWPRPGEAAGGGVDVGQWRMMIWTDKTIHYRSTGGN